MKLQILLENIKKGILSAERIIGRNLALPILSNILIEAEKGGLKILATNLEIGIIYALRAKVEKKGKIAVPGRIMSSYLNNLDNQDKLSLEEKNFILYITSKEGRALIKGVDPKDFPIIPRPNSDYLIEIDGYEFQQKIGKLVTSAATTETRQELTSVFFGLEENKLILAATDSFRLGEAIISLSKNNLSNAYQSYISKNRSVLVPAKTLQEVIRNIGLNESKLKINIGESQIFFKTEEALFVSRLIDGKYPEYNQVIPKKFSQSLYLNREDLIKAIKTASIFSDTKNHEVRLVSKEKSEEIIVESQSVEVGENITKLRGEVNVKGESILAFNNRYILDALNSISTDRVYIGFNDNFSPVVFREVLERNELNDKYTHIVMPIKT